jgi:hypothetical protein
MVEVTDFIDQVFAQDFSKASPTFNELIGDKMSAALEAEKIQVASRVFDGTADQYAEDQYEMDLDEDDTVDEDPMEEAELDDAAADAMEDDISDEED